MAVKKAREKESVFLPDFCLLGWQISPGYEFLSWLVSRRLFSKFEQDQPPNFVLIPTYAAWIRLELEPGIFAESFWALAPS